MAEVQQLERLIARMERWLEGGVALPRETLYDLSQLLAVWRQAQELPPEQRYAEQLPRERLQYAEELQHQLSERKARLPGEAARR